MSGSINGRVVQWARGKRGQQVGAGECWDLADRALRQAGGQSSTTTDPDDDYVWGNVVDLKDVLPGDILQFRDFVVDKTTQIDAVFSDGSSMEETQTAQETREHHTAIVDAVIDPFTLIILEQNAPPAGKKVQRRTLSIQSSGPTVRVAQKRVKLPSGESRLGKVTTTVTVEVSGSLWAYHPKAR